jgi:hypothetical protein
VVNVAANELDAFLADPADAAAVPPEAPVEAPAAPAAPTPPQEAKPAPAASKPEEEADTEPPAPREGDEIVPRNAYEAERRRRQDWKERATKAETEREMLAKQIEELKRAAAAPPPQPHEPPPQPQIRLIDPTQDPVGFAAQVQELADQRAAFRAHHMNANWSEYNLRKEIGDEKVDQLIVDFQQAAAADPTLNQKLFQQRDPYKWAHQQLETLRMQREIGDDPAAYRARIEAEARAKWEAEAEAAQAPTQAQTVIANMPRSLATARSVASRSAPAFTGSAPLQDILGHRR